MLECYHEILRARSYGHVQYTQLSSEQYKMLGVCLPVYKTRTLTSGLSLLGTYTGESRRAPFCGIRILSDVIYHISVISDN